jgi:hypothetical protein
MQQTSSEHKYQLHGVKESLINNGSTKSLTEANLKVIDDSQGTPETGTDLVRKQSTIPEFGHASVRIGTTTYAYRMKTEFSIQKPLGGILVEINGGLSSAPINNTPRNTELFHLCKFISLINLEKALIITNSSPSLCDSGHVLH